MSDLEEVWQAAKEAQVRLYAAIMEATDGQDGDTLPDATTCQVTVGDVRLQTRAANFLRAENKRLREALEKLEADYEVATAKYAALKEPTE